jgi:hypothetical protein
MEQPKRSMERFVTMDHPRSEMLTLLEWAQARLTNGHEPPWSWYQIMKLREVLQSILASAAATTTESSPQSDRSQGKHLRLVETTDRQDMSPHHPAGLPVRLPM